MTTELCDLVSVNLVTLHDFGAALPAAAIWGAALFWGLCVGSFATVAVERWPAIIEGRMPGSALWYPGSRCPPCGRPLRFHHCLPLLGLLWSKGRCACGRMAIPPRYVALEAGGAAVMAATVTLAPGATDHLALMLLFAGLLYLLAVVDLASGYLPDSLTLGLLWTGLLASAAVPCGLPAVAPADAVLGAAFGWLVMAAVATLGTLALGREALGRGDWKLVAAVGAWGGIGAVVLVLLFGSLAALAMTPWLRRGALPGDTRPPAAVPFGPGLALAALPIVAAGLTPAQLFS